MARARRGGVGWRAVPAFLAAALWLLLVAAEAGTYNAVFNFGDSLVDAGNLVTEGIPDYLATARPPYGQSYFGYPTGRCSDGRLVIDFIAQEFGLPLLPPSKAKNASFAQGANFAITGATALDTEFFEKRGLGKSVWNSGSLFTQIQWLRDLKPSFCNSTQECKDFFAKSLFVVGELGGNDYNAPLFAGKDLREAYNLMPHVVQGISDGVETLNGSIHNHLWHQSPNLGARHPAVSTTIESQSSIYVAASPTSVTNLSIKESQALEARAARTLTASRCSTTVACATTARTQQT